MPALFCDVNETTLDLAPVREVVDGSLGEGGSGTWFARMLHLSTVNAMVGPHRPFGELGRAAFLALGGDEAVWPDVVAAFGRLPAYPDVRPGLERFRAAGWEVFALTNSSPATVEAGFGGADVADLFDRRFSVDSVGRFKPAPEPYLHALDETGVDVGSAWMVACHDWDLAGAADVGMPTAYITRPTVPWADVYPAPTVTTDGYEGLADLLLG